VTNGKNQDLSRQQLKDPFLKNQRAKTEINPGQEKPKSNCLGQEDFVLRKKKMNVWWSGG